MAKRFACSECVRLQAWFNYQLVFSCFLVIITLFF